MASGLVLFFLSVSEEGVGAGVGVGAGGSSGAGGWGEAAAEDDGVDAVEKWVKKHDFNNHLFIFIFIFY